MELENMKLRFQEIENQLKKQELLNEKLINGIRQTRSGAFANLKRYIQFGLVLLLACAVFVIYHWTHTHFGLHKTIAMCCAALLALSGITISIYNLCILHKVDFTDSIDKNIRTIEHFWIAYKRQFLFMYALSGLFVIVFVSVFYVSSIAAGWWTLISFVVISAVLLSYWEHKIYKRNMQSIMESLNKLKELEEDE
jgi:Flp pilus assembly protein TadB